MGTDKICKAANRCLEMGISVVPIGEKKLPSIRWKSLIDEPLKSWNYPGCNMAILTGAGNGIVVVDCDNKKDSLKWLATMPKTPLMVLTVRGMHFYYRHPGVYVKSDSHIHLNGVVFDVKGDRSFVLSPPSVRGGIPYSFCKHAENPSGKWLPPEKLPLFDMAWRPERAFMPSVKDDEQIGNIERYISKISSSEGGRDRATYRVAKLVMESGACESDAMAIVINWHLNNCTPPWSVPEISEKVKRVYRCT
jgi:hypothetical protein